MGQSTDAILFYGVAFEEEDEVPAFLQAAGFDDFEEYVEAQSGLPLYGERGYSFEDHRKFKKSYPVALVMHCSCDYPMYGLAVNGTEMCANRGNPIELENGLPEITNDQEQAFLNWMAEHDINLGDPKWVLCSQWC